MDLANLLGFSGPEITFHDCASAALRALLTHWNFPASSTVWVASNEFGPNLAEFARRGYSVVTIGDEDDYGHADPRTLEEMLTSQRPSFIHLCQLGSHSGVVQPVSEIVEIARRAKVPVVIDVAQAAGHQPTVTAADATYGTSRKWLAGPRGIGFLALRTAMPGPTTLTSAAPDNSHSFIAGRLGLGAALRELHDLGPQTVFTELAAIGGVVRERLHGVGGWQVVEPFTEPSATTTLTPPPGWVFDDIARVRDSLLTRGFLVTAADIWRAPLRPPSPALRISPHLGLRYDQLDRFAAELTAMSG